MPAEVFGQPISQTDANDYFSRYIGIKQRCMQTFRDVLATDLEARRYYCGQDSGNPVEQDWAFVFDKDCLQRLMEDMDSLQANCVFVFNAAKGRIADTEDPQNTSAAGRPTLLLIPAKYHADVNPGDTEFELFNGNGRQFPGNGGGTLVAGQPVVLPDSFPKGQYGI